MFENVTIDTFVRARWCAWSCWLPGGVVSRIDKILPLGPSGGYVCITYPKPNWVSSPSSLLFLPPVSSDFAVALRNASQVGNLKSYRLYAAINDYRMGCLDFALEGAGPMFNICKPLNAGPIRNDHTPRRGLAQKVSPLMVRAF